ncbi:MAG: PEP-CTERM sorting domain-containing protein [Sphingobium sp.]|nr:PEP-CTERM sorting domain-containing protein [Sphingobium sp.]
MTGAGTQSGSWSTPGYLIQYLAVSGGNKTFLYYLGGVSSGDWSTLGIVNNGGQQPNLSHLAFFGTQAPVPEPATWAMLIAGMGIVGASMRRRKTAVSFA